MIERISDDELAAALAEAIDHNGVDQRLASATAAMTEEERLQSEENLRRWAADVQASLRSKRGQGDTV